MEPEIESNEAYNRRLIAEVRRREQEDIDRIIQEHKDAFRAAAAITKFFKILFLAALIIGSGFLIKACQGN